VPGSTCTYRLFRELGPLNEVWEARKASEKGRTGRAIGHNGFDPGLIPGTYRIEDVRFLTVVELM
jgi:hypothetical protein